MAVVYPDPKFLIFKKIIQSDTINKIKHNGTKQIILISVLYQNAFTSQILETSPQGLISTSYYFTCYYADKSIENELNIMQSCFFEIKWKVNIVNQVRIATHD